MAIPTILQGDDTAAHGRTLRIILPDGDYTGVEFRLDICGMSREWMSPADGWLEFTFGADETRLMPLGTHSGRLRVRGADGVTYTLSNAVRIRVTDCPAEAYGADAQTIDLGLGTGGGGGLPDLTGITGDPETPNELAAAWREFMSRLRGAAGGLLLALVASASLADGLTVQTAPSGDLPWGAEVVTNVTGGADGAARPLPRYLHCLDFADSYPDAAAWYYAQPQDYGHCSAVRDGNALYRNYDWRYDDAAEFVVRVSAGPGRAASVGVANVGTNLTESAVTSGEWSRYYKCLPGRTVDGINEHGVVAEVNVVDGPVTGWQTRGSLHPLAAVRWVLDNAESASEAAEYLADNIRFPDGWTQNFHWMVADSTATYIVENGAAHEAAGRAVMTNFRLFPSRDTAGAGQERYNILNDGSNITNAWYTRAYLRTTDWESEFADAAEMEAAKAAWETHKREALRGKGLWQTVHTSIYDLTNRTLRVAVQETDDWYTFAVPVTGGGTVDAYTKAEADAQFARRNTENGVVVRLNAQSELVEDEGPTIYDSHLVTFTEFSGARYVNNALDFLNDTKVDRADLSGLATNATIGDVVAKINEIAAAFSPQEEEE